MRFVVFNPQSGGGRTGREWPVIARRLEAAVGPFTCAASSGRDDATLLVRQAVAVGATEVIAVGGDGTISEAVNGLFDTRQAQPSPVIFGFVSAGTGGDFARTLGVAPGIEAACERLRSGQLRRVDVGCMTFAGARGEIRTRCFANIASLGVTGAIAWSASSAGLSRVMGARLMFRYHTVAQLLRYRFPMATVEIDGNARYEGPIAAVVVANGAHFGGGMHIAPMAVMSDGLLDVVVIRGESKRELIAALGLVYTGAHLSHPAVRTFRGRRVRISALAPGQRLALEADGEAPGASASIVFDVMPAALALRC